MADYSLIARIVSKSRSALRDVEFKYIQPALIEKDVLTASQLSQLNAPSFSEVDKNNTLFDKYTPTLGLEGFKKLIGVIRQYYPHVSRKLIEELNSSINSSDKSSSLESTATSACGASSHPAFFSGNETHPPMGLSELSSLMGTFHITGNECQEDLRTFRQQQKPKQQHEQTFVKQEVNRNRLFVDDSKQACARPLGRPSYGKETYPMDTNPRGIAFIINNDKFNNFKQREGTDVDREKLAKMFHDIGWHVTTKNNLTAQQMDAYLKKLAKDERLKPVSAIAVAILTHGMTDDIYFGTDGSYFNDQPNPRTFINRFQLMQNFTSSHCPMMMGKPKLFILQACRGGEDDIVTTKKGVEKQRINQHFDSDAPDPPHHVNHLQENRQTPDTGDMCFVFASSLGYKAYRMRNSGSPFIKTLTETVIELAANTEFGEIMKQVRAKLARQNLPENKKTLSEFTTQLIKDWYLNPPQSYLT